MTPPYPSQERLGKLSFFGGCLPSISLLYLASALRDHCELSVLDASFLDFDEEIAMDAVRRFTPDIVGISADFLKFFPGLRVFAPKTLLSGSRNLIRV